MAATPPPNDIPDGVFYVECLSVPPGMTISQYRVSRPSRLTRLMRLKQLGGMR